MSWHFKGWEVLGQKNAVKYQRHGCNWQLRRFDYQGLSDPDLLCNLDNLAALLLLKVAMRLRMTAPHAWIPPTWQIEKIYAKTMTKAQFFWLHSGDLLCCFLGLSRWFLWAAAGADTVAAGEWSLATFFALDMAASNWWQKKAVMPQPAENVQSCYLRRILLKLKFPKMLGIFANHVVVDFSWNMSVGSSSCSRRVTTGIMEPMSENKWRFPHGAGFFLVTFEVVMTWHGNWTLKVVTLLRPNCLGKKAVCSGWAQKVPDVDLKLDKLEHWKRPLKRQWIESRPTHTRHTPSFHNFFHDLSERRVPPNVVPDASLAGLHKHPKDTRTFGIYVNCEIAWNRILHIYTLWSAVSNSDKTRLLFTAYGCIWHLFPPNKYRLHVESGPKIDDVPWHGRDLPVERERATAQKRHGRGMRCTTCTHVIHPYPHTHTHTYIYIYNICKNGILQMLSQLFPTSAV